MSDQRFPKEGERTTCESCGKELYFVFHTSNAKMNGYGFYHVLSGNFWCAGNANSSAGGAVVSAEMLAEFPTLQATNGPQYLKKK